MDSFEIFKKPNTLSRSDFLIVSDIANELNSFLREKSSKKSLAEAHVLGASSHKIQEIILPKAAEMGFSSERNGLFGQYKNSKIRPDYYLPINETGILMEVERGKTLANNMDLLDLWKCHICNEAHYLFLIVPNERQTGKGRANTVFPAVCSRISTFFTGGNYVDVEAAFIYGY